MLEIKNTLLIHFCACADGFMIISVSEIIFENNLSGHADCRYVLFLCSESICDPCEI